MTWDLADFGSDKDRTRVIRPATALVWAVTKTYLI